MAAAAEPTGQLIATTISPGQSADDPLYTPLIQRVRAMLGQPGLLYSGDCNSLTTMSVATITQPTPKPLSVPAKPDEDAIIGKAYDPHIARRLLGYVRPYQKQILIALVWMTIAMAAYIVGPYLIKVALDSGMAARNPDVLAQVVALYLVAGFVQWIGTYLRIRIMAVVGQSIIFDMRRELFDRLQLFSLGFFSRYAVGRLISRVINDVGVLREMITWAVLAVFRDFFDLFGGVQAVAQLPAPVVPFFIGNVFIN